MAKLTQFMGEDTLNVDELFVCSYVFVSIAERANETKQMGFQAPFCETKNVLIAFQILARIHDEATKSGDSSDFSLYDYVNAGADERSNNSCEENKYETRKEKSTS
jgi:hypothetical protein